MIHRPLLLLFVLTLRGSFAAPPLIPAERTFGAAWQSAGYGGELPAPSTIVNVRDFGANGNGASNDHPAITAAIAALSNAPGVVYFPAGSYLVTSSLYLRNGVVFRGERSQNTSIVSSNLTQHVLNIVANQTGVFQPVLSGSTVHSNVLQVTDGTVFAAGDYAEIREDNDPSWGASSWAPKVCGQILTIAAVDGNTLTLAKPLRITLPAGLNPEIRKVQLIQDAGVENLRISRIPSGVATDRDNMYTINFEYAAHCWVRGVESTNSFGANVGLSYCTQMEITGCYFHHAYEVDGGGSGYGVILQFKSGECRVENNIFRLLRHAMLLQAGANGNVFGYNYSREATRTEPPSDASGDIVTHGNYPFANLFEGNIVQHAWLDNSHNANGPFNTLFRNRTEYAGINVTDPACTNLNVVGNETYTGSFLIQLGVGDGYKLQGTGNFAYGNNTQSDGIQAPGTTNLTDYSYYLNADPSVPPPLPGFWNITNEFPTIGLPLARTATKEIPARVRYFAGTNFTVGPPSLARQPTDVLAQTGDTATFTVQATGTPEAVFAWHKDNIALPGQTNATLTLTNVQPANAGQYSALITDNYGSVRSAPAALTVQPPADLLDADNDSLPDAWEILHFSSTNAPAGDASADMDDDGYTTFQEYILGTYPTVTSSRFELHVDNADGTIVVHFTALAATGTGYTSLYRYYALEHCTDLELGDWQPVPGYDNLSGNNSDVTYNVPAATAATFYRVRVHLQ